MEKFLVTGGAGFIGSNMVEELLKRGYFVRVVDNYLTGKKENVSEFSKDIELIEGDIRDINMLMRSTKGIDYVIHLAALGSVPRSIKDPATTHEINADGTLNILLASQKARVRKVIYSSSSSVYGDSPTLLKKESFTPNPKSPYAVSKLTGEYYCCVFRDVYGLETVSLRYFNVYGKKQDPDSHYAAVVPKFIKAFKNNRRPQIYGDGHQSRDFTFIEDCIEATIKAVFSENSGGQIINISYGQRVTVNELFNLIKKITGKNIEPIYSDSRPGDIRHSLAFIEKAEDLLGYKPSFPIKRGLKKTIEHYFNS